MTSSAFTPDQRAALEALVAQIIPASDAFNQPGADDPLILGDILTSAAALAPRLAAALQSLPAPDALDNASAASFRQSFPEEAELIQTVTVQCYYRDDRVMRALGIDPRPPFPGGYRQESNDLTLLDPVRARGEIFRKLP